jgi:hypothetical protein
LGPPLETEGYAGVSEVLDDRREPLRVHEQVFLLVPRPHELHPLVDVERVAPF